MSLDGYLQAAQQCSAGHDWLGAAAAFGTAARLRPDDRRLVNNQGHALWLADLPHAAEGCYRRALALEPDCPIARCGLAHCLRDLNRFEDAALAYAAAGGAEAHWGLSQVLIGLERYGEAYGFAECRQQVAAWRPLRPPPFWGGQPLANVDAGWPLTIWSEQGIGDTFHYLRWLPRLARQRQQQAGERGVEPGEISLLVPGSLVRILREGLAWMDSPPRILAQESVALGPEAPQGPLLSLPHELGGAPLADPVGGATLRSPLWGCGGPSLLSGERGSGPAVGLVWASGRKLDDPFTRREYLKRSLPPGALWRLIDGLRRAGADLVSLQHGNDEDLAGTVGFELPPPRLPLAEFAHVARVVSQLDLVISVDTAMAHLAGSMGVPGWILLPWSADPRWLRDRDDSPWYRSLRLFRQPAGGQWEPAIEAVLDRFRMTRAAGAGW